MYSFPTVKSLWHVWNHLLYSEMFLVIMVLKCCYEVPLTLASCLSWTQADGILLRAPSFSGPRISPTVFCFFVRLFFLVSESETKFYSPAFKPYVIHVAYKIFLPFGISGNNFHSYVYQIKQKYACYKHNYVQQKFNKNSRRTLRWDLDSSGLAHVLTALKPWPQLSLLTSLGKITNRLNHFSLAVGHY